MKLKILPQTFSILKLEKDAVFDLSAPFTFFSVTDEERSLVCPSDFAPEGVLQRDDDWRGFRIDGVLDFSLIGILSKISAILAENQIGIFVVSTYNTDYVFVKNENFENALSALKKSGYET